MAKARGQGRVYRPTYTYKGERRKSAVWWIEYYRGGKKVRESSRSQRQRDAVELLTSRNVDRGQAISRRDLERVTFEKLEALIVADYEKNGMRSLPRLKRSLKHLKTVFGGRRVVDIGEAAIDQYAADRLANGAANATVNRELAALKRMFRLGDRARLVERVPAIDMLRENNVRKGFVEEAQFQAIQAALPDRLKVLAEVAYATGWRSGELITRRWRHVDLAAGWLRMEPGETKNGEGRQFPLFPRLREALEEQYERKLETERLTGKIVTALFFTETGEPIRDFRGAWKTACDAAKCPERLFHDFRRTAARNLIRAGVSETVAMKLTGHLTPSVFRRYAIVDETMLKEGVAKLAAHLVPAEPDRKVVDLTGKEQARNQTGTG